jgi:O-antigen/teichoic acid export membrane protein
MSSRRLLSNSIANVLGFIAQFIVSFALAPIVLRALGDDRYGVWSFAESVLAYLMLFDVGVASALVRYVPRHLATQDQAALNRVFSASLLFFSLIAAAAGLAAAPVLYFGLDRFLEVPSDFAGEVRLVLLGVVANFATVLPLSVFPAMLDGLNEFRTKTAVRTSFLIARIPATLWAIRLERPLLALILVLAVSNVLESLVIAALVVRRIPGLRFVPAQIDRPTIRAIGGFSFNSFLAMIAGRLTFSTDALVIGKALGAAAITPFAFANRLVDLARFLLRSTTVTLTPAISAAEARGDLRAIRSYFLHGTRLVLYAALPIQAGLLILGKPFLAIWLRDMGLANSAGPTLWVLAATLSLTIAQSAASRVLYGTGRIRLFARMALAEGVANLLISLALVRPLGIVGVAWGTAIPHVGFCCYAVAHACKLTGVRPAEHLRCWVAPVVFALVPTIIWLIAMQVAPPAGWGEFALIGLLGMLPYSGLVLVTEGRPWLAAGVYRAQRWLIAMRDGQNAAR